MICSVNINFKHDYNMRKYADCDCKQIQWNVFAFVESKRRNGYR